MFYFTKYNIYLFFFKLNISFLKRLQAKCFILQKINYIFFVFKKNYSYFYTLKFSIISRKILYDNVFA